MRRASPTDLGLGWHVKKRAEEKPLRIHQAVARKIGSAILRGEYKPGDIIGGEIEQSQALQVSRTPYREAIRILVAKGLLESRPKVGTCVTPRDRWNFLDPDILSWMFTGKPDEGFIKDLFELRGMLEPGAARLAAERRTEAELAVMQGALETMGRHGFGSAEGQAADQVFHKALLSAARNEALASLASSIGSAVQWTTHFKQQASHTPRDPLPDHIAIFEAIRDADPDRAQSAMSDLLRMALEDMAAAL